MKFKLNRTYATIAAYALLVIAFALLLGVIFFNIDTVFDAIAYVFDKLTSLLLGVFFTFCFLPFVRFFERIFRPLFCKKRERSTALAFTATILVDLLFLTLLTLFFVAFIPSFIDGYNSFRHDLIPQITEISRRIEESGSPVLMTVYRWIYDTLAAMLEPETGTLVATVTAIVSTIFSRTYDIALGLVFATYFLIFRRYLSTLSNKLVAAFLPKKFRAATFAVVKRIYNFFVEFFSYRLVTGCSLAIITYLLFIPFKIPYGIVIALIVCIASFIPVFGPIAATLGSSILIGIFAPSDMRLWQSLAVLIILSSLHLLVTLFIEPFCLRKKLRPGPGVSVVCIIISYAVLGYAGIIFAVPLYASLDVVYRELLARLLARKNLPLTNSYYLDLQELPLTPKASQTAGGDEEEQAFIDAYGMTPQEAAESNLVILQSDAGGDGEAPPDES